MQSRFVPPAGAPRVLALAQLTNAIGDGAYLVTSALYFTRVVGLTPAQVGLGLTLGWALGFMAGVPLGHLADRRGPRGVAMLLAVGTSASVAAFLVVRSFPLFLVAVCLYGVAQTGLSAARQALLAALVKPAKRTQTRAYLQSTLNAGLAVGAAIGGIALHLDTRGAYLGALALDTVAFLLAAALLLRLPAVPPAPRAATAGPALTVLRDRPYAVITFLNMLMLLYMPLLSLVVPLWIVQRTDAPSFMVSALLVLNTLSVVLFQVRMARRVTDLRSAALSVRLAGVIMLAACVVFALTSAWSGAWAATTILLAGAVLQVIGEMMLAAGAWQISFDLAPADKQGQYQGFFGTGTAVARALGPALLTTVVLGWGAVGWLMLGGLFLAAGAAMPAAVSRASQTRESTSPLWPCRNPCQATPAAPSRAPLRASRQHRHRSAAQASPGSRAHDRRRASSRNLGRSRRTG